MSQILYPSARIAAYKGSADGKQYTEQPEGTKLLFQCPGCKCGHFFVVKRVEGLPHWEWNGSMDKPTFTPSLLVRGMHVCHSYVTDGKIQFLNDCSHELAGQTVQLEPW